MLSAIVTETHVPTQAFSSEFRGMSQADAELWVVNHNRAIYTAYDAHDPLAAQILHTFARASVGAEGGDDLPALVAEWQEREAAKS